jgi:hypothetical protein
MHMPRTGNSTWLITFDHFFVFRLLSVRAPLLLMFIYPSHPSRNSLIFQFMPIGLLRGPDTGEGVELAESPYLSAADSHRHSFSRPAEEITCMNTVTFFAAAECMPFH